MNRLCRSVGDITGEFLRRELDFEGTEHTMPAARSPGPDGLIRSLKLNLLPAHKLKNATLPSALRKTSQERRTRTRDSAEPSVAAYIPALRPQASDIIRHASFIFISTNSRTFLALRQDKVPGRTSSCPLVPDHVCFLDHFKAFLVPRLDVSFNSDR